jgi:hypothetical protein
MHVLSKMDVITTTKTSGKFVILNNKIDIK